MTAKLIDIAWARPTIAQIKATGAQGVGRYFSTDSTKNIKAAEVRDYAAAGLTSFVVWETSTGRARAGFAAGQADARSAEAQRKSVGLPDDMPIHFAVDEDTSWSSVQSYFSGAASVIGQKRVGVYGGFAVIEGAAAAGYTYLWQTIAWSNGRWSSHATIQQRGGTTLGGSADFDYAMAVDYGQFPRPEVDMPLTDQEKKDVAALSAQATVEALTAPGARDSLAFADVYWLRRAFDPTIPLPTGKNLPGVVTETAALRAALVAQSAAQKAAIEALVKAIGASGGITAEQVQAAAEAGAKAALAELGHVLDGTQPTG